MMSKIHEVVVMLVLVCVAVSAELPPATESYKILMLEPLGTISTRNFIFHLAEVLADRGHQVVILASLPPKKTKRNITQYQTKFKYLENVDADTFAMMESDDEIPFWEEFLPPMASELYEMPIVNELYHRRKEFDLITVDHIYNEMVYPFLHEMPFISIATYGVDPHQSAMFGNVLHPAYTPAISNVIQPPWTVYQRLKNLLFQIHFAFFYDHWSVVPKIQKRISKLFPDIPPLLEIQRNQSLVLVNSHFSMDVAQPLLPSQVEVAGMHCRPGKPLPQELEAWIAGAGEAGIVYFSLGTLTKGTMMPSQYRDLFIKAFKKVPQRVIWKFEGELSGLSDNVLTRSWLPQQDILSDPRVKVFISHGGLFSTHEAMYHAKPVIALPIHTDQPRNAQKIAGKGFGLYLKWKELTVDLIIQSIQEIISNPQYMEKVQKVSSALKDQPQTPTDRAIYWTEYVIRHKGAPQLRSPAAQLSWPEFLMLDILAFVILTTVVVCYILLRLLTLGINIAIGKGSKKNKKE